MEVSLEKKKIRSTRGISSIKLGSYAGNDDFLTLT